MNVKGFTLIELTIVLLILAALAGIALPTVDSLTKTAQSAAGASNSIQVGKSIEQFRNTYGQYPDGWDSLLAYGGATVNGNISNANNPFNAPVGPDFAAGALTQGEFDALTEAGITTLQEMADDPANATINPYSSGPTAAVNQAADTIVLANGDPIVRLTAAAITRLGLQVNGNGGGAISYIALGVGSRTTMLGRTIASIPVHNSERSKPIDSYSRYIAIFAVNPDFDAAQINVNNFSLKYTIVGAAVNSGFEINDGHLRDYYETTDVNLNN